MKDAKHVHEIQSVYADNIRVDINELGATITFGENQPGTTTPLWHTRIRLPLALLRPMINNLGNMADKFEDQMNQQQADASKN